MSWTRGVSKRHSRMQSMSMAKLRYRHDYIIVICTITHATCHAPCGLKCVVVLGSKIRLEIRKLEKNRMKMGRDSFALSNLEERLSELVRCHHIRQHEVIERAMSNTTTNMLGGLKIRMRNWSKRNETSRISMKGFVHANPERLCQVKRVKAHLS